MAELAALRLELAPLLLLLLLSAPTAVRCCPASVPSSPAASSAHTPDNTFTQADSAISVSSNSRFFLQLPSNPSTGFSWDWTDDAAGGSVGLLRLLSCGYQRAPHAAGIVGSGGFELWELVSGPHAGQEELQLSYSRPWEQRAQHQPTASWTVTVSEAEAAEGGGGSKTL